MIRPFLPLAGLLAPVLIAAAAPALADDPRLVSRRYDAGQVVRIDGRTGVQASIAFAEDELVENVAIGDSNAWQVTPNKRANMLFVKPLAAAARTNMTVVTDRHTYFFDLVASPRANPLYVLRFTYPEAPRKALPTLSGPPVLTSEEAAIAANDPAARPAAPAVLHRDWARKGAASVMPASVHDDGSATFLAWSPGKPIPAILVRNAKGEEGPVNFAVRDDVIVVDGVPPVIVLRAGKDSATLERQAHRASLAATTPVQKD
jgi:type IV secretion system protein VirB9